MARSFMDSLIYDLFFNYLGTCVGKGIKKKLFVSCNSTKKTVDRKVRYNLIFLDYYFF